MGQPAAKVSGGKLPGEIAGALEPRLRHALEHSVRRQVMRVVDESGQALSVGAIGAALAGHGVGRIGYHVQVLEQAGALVAETGAAASDRERRLYSSGIEDDLNALSALRVTQHWDRDRGQSSGSRSARFLAMFRIPRPVLTVRLGDRKERRHEERE